jgi:hypothetical protein
VSGAGLPGELALAEPAGPFIYVAFDPDSGRWRKQGLGHTREVVDRLRAAEDGSREGMMRQWERCYAGSGGNPLYAVEAFLRTDPEEPLPPWLLSYLRRALSAVRDLARKHDAGEITAAKAAAETARALGLIKGNNRNEFAEWRKDNAAAWTALDYNYFGMGDSAASQLANERGVTSTNIYEIVTRARKHKRSTG